MPRGVNSRRRSRDNANGYNPNDLSTHPDWAAEDPNIADSDNVSGALHIVAAAGVVAQSLSLGQQILYILSIVTPVLAALKAVRSLLPSVSPLISAVFGPPVSYLVASLPVPTRRNVWMTGFTMSLIGLGFPRVSFGFPGRHMLRSYPGFGWFPTRKIAVPLRKVAAAFILASIGWWVATKVAARLSSPIGARLTTRLISRTLRHPVLSSSQQRQVFVDTPLVSGRIHGNHTHGEAARDRNAAGATSTLICSLLGLTPYYFQKSLADVRKSYAGDRSFHWAKDLAVPPEEFSFDSEVHAGVLVDVDHYLDMPSLLARYPGTYFICTFQPTAAAVSVGEYSFRFLANGNVLYQVSGGAEYEHPVWDYAGDTLIVEDCGFLSKTVVAYHIDRKRIDDHHCIVMLSVVASFTMPTVSPTSMFIEGKRLCRFNPVFGDHAVIDIVRAEGRFRSVAILGDFLSVTMPRSDLDAVHAVALIARTEISAAMVASNIAPSDALGLPTARLAPGHAAILASYTRAGVPEFAPVVYPSSQSMLAIAFDKHDYDAPCRLTGFGAPLIAPCYGFVSSVASDDKCISGRVEAFQGRMEAEIEPSLALYMREFAAFVVPVAGIGHPVDHEEVGVRQNSPSQRQILKRAALIGQWFKRRWDAFNKTETYPKITHPRNISIAQPATKLAYSRYIYAFTDVIMSQFEWYAFNKTPFDVAQRVCAVLANAKWSICADGSRFDGHVGRRARILERMIMLRFFAREHHSALNEVMNEQISLPGVSEFGRRYNSGFSRGSGSLETASFNSILTAFIGYCAQRNTCVGGARKSPQQAWESLGIYGGDDSLEGDVDPKALEISSQMMGQVYEIDVIKRGDIGVEFLNRQFGPDVWTGDPSSMANPSRALAKLFVGPTHLVDPLTRLGERLSGYYRMDRNSPVLGEITTVAQGLLGVFTEGELMPYGGELDRRVNWPNEDSGWMDHVFSTFLPDFDHQRFFNWIDRIATERDPELFLQAPLCTPAGALEPIVVKEACVVGEFLEQPPEKAAPAPIDSGKNEAPDLPRHDDLKELYRVAESVVQMPPMENQQPPEDGIANLLPRVFEVHRDTPESRSSSSGSNPLNKAGDHHINQSRRPASNGAKKPRRERKPHANPNPEVKNPDKWKPRVKAPTEQARTYQAYLTDFQAKKRIAIVQFNRQMAARQREAAERNWKC